VGVYKRELFNKPLGHAVQMKAIEVLKKRGICWYEIGQKHLKIDKIPATDKELSISHFKEGFATHVIARQHLIVNMQVN
jgi:lipid II:glycine glycyltransferase (peptidoglycan interpeptide bridge formation enzyme)